MKNEAKIAVIVPAFNEELLIKKTIDSVPDFVEKIIVINDKSTDKTEEVVNNEKKLNSKIVLINHSKNKGVGASLISGYQKSLELEMDITVVMPGDAQALPDDFTNLVNPVLEGKADYSKGNRLNHKDVKSIMPRYRFVGNTFLSLFTKFASGYYTIMDPQMGYTAINNSTLKKIDLSKMIKRYGYPGQLLHFLNLVDAVVCDVDIIPHYGEEKSGLRVWNILPKLTFLLIGLFFKRVFKKLIFRDLSPAGISYLLSFITLFVAEPILLSRVLRVYEQDGFVPELTFIMLLVFFILFILFFFFGLLFDIQENKDLNFKIRIF